MVSKNKMVKVIKIKSRIMGIRVKINIKETRITRRIIKIKMTRKTEKKLMMKKNTLLMQQRKFSPSQPSLSKRPRSFLCVGSINTRNATEKNPASFSTQRCVANIWSLDPRKQIQKRAAIGQNAKNTTPHYAMGVQDTRNAGPEAAKRDIYLELSLLKNK